MKRWKRILAGILAMAMILPCLPGLGLETEAAGSETQVFGDFEYVIHADCVGIGKYTGKGGDVVIPSEIDGKQVTRIETGAFKDCSSLTSVTIPASVTNMEGSAFSDCSGLTSVTISPGLKEIEQSAFVGANALTSVTIPKSVTRIGSSAFGYKRVFGQGHSPFGSLEKIPDFTIYGTKGTAAEKYAKDNGFTFNTGSEKTDISKASVTLSKTSYTYDGKAKKPSVTVKLNGKKLSANKDYTVSYSNNTRAGTAKVTVTGKGKYMGKKSVTFKIVKAADSKITCKKTVYKVAYGAKPFKINATSKSKMTFTSSKPKIATVNKNTGKVTIKNTGIAIITIKAGSTTKKVTIKVSPKKPSVKTAKAAEGKKLTMSWAKDKMALGYYVQISTDKKFKKNMKSKALSKTSYTFTKLETGKKYYVRIRSYKKSGKEILYSAWSKAKLSGKIKK
ncbi:MAG: leucine-rich repeat protein [Lachnospiraceae bacterium]|nr:leucine-rich repeat protein [Lachnospiraceae bacterium]